MEKIKQVLNNYKFKNNFKTYLLSLRLLAQRIFVKKNLPSIALVLVLLLIASGVILGLYKLVAKAYNFDSSKVQIADAKATTTLNKEFAFPLKNASGKEVSKVKYTIETADLRDEILVKGQRARSIKGRTFLILNLKVVNDFDQKIEIQTGDYVRLSVNGNKDVWTAPDTHSDPVAIQAISTKYVRIGFAINDSDKELLLRVGEINGEKQEVPINFWNKYMNDYSTQNVSAFLLEELKRAIESVPDYGSIEIFVTDGVVSQISTRKIKKTMSNKHQES